MSVISIFDGDFAFLSNFYPSRIMIDGIVYPTVEHAFQAFKTLNLEERKKIANAETPGQAKRLGRKVSLREDWEDIKEDVMLTLIRTKFKDPRLQDLLFKTGESELIEGTLWHDNIWGNCSCNRCKNIPGQNKLGKILMKVRKELREYKKINS